MAERKIIVVTNNYGDVQLCKQCKSPNTVGYHMHFPANSTAFNSLRFAYCEEHEKEVTQMYYDAEQRKDRIQIADSNS